MVRNTAIGSASSSLTALSPCLLVYSCTETVGTRNRQSYGRNEKNGVRLVRLCLQKLLRQNAN